MMKKCFGCLAEFQKTTDDPIIPHPYIGAICECWTLYGDILAKEYSDSDHFKVHRTTVDAYAAQHIGNQEDRRARQSANVHLIALYLAFARKVEAENVLEFLRKATAIKQDWPPLIQRANPRWFTVRDVAVAENPSEHTRLVMQWGKSVWEAYEDCHEEIIRVYEKT